VIATSGLVAGCAAHRPLDEAAPSGRCGR